MYLLIDNYDSFTYNLVHYFGELGINTDVRRNDEISVEDALALKPSGVILSPGPCDPDRAGICLDMVKAAADNGIPLIGVCLGHQTIGQFFGGKVVRVPPMHGKLSDINHNNDGVFKDLPNPLKVTRYHSLAVAKDGWPDCLAVTAESDDGIIMGLQHRQLPIHGVQFHPESIASQAGHQLLKNFIDLTNN